MSHFRLKFSMNWLNMDLQSQDDFLISNCSGDNIMQYLKIWQWFAILALIFLCPLNSLAVEWKGDTWNVNLNGALRGAGQGLLGGRQCLVQRDDQCVVAQDHGHGFGRIAGPLLLENADRLGDEW